VPAITVGLPAALTAPHPSADHVVDAATVGEALHALVNDAPQYRPRIFYGKRLLVVVALNGVQLAPGGVLETALSAGDRLDVLLPVAGG
jgi:molybdopterin converting factor small subunit